MITIAQLDEFQKYLSSPQVECDFYNASEKERGEMLELLEKLMDVAEEADKVATALIFRGRIPGVPANS